MVNGDIKGLEIVCAAELSKDAVLMEELFGRADIHANNQKAFNLPSRLIAKVLKFRIIYGGSSYSFAHDPDFMDVSKSEKFWQGVIDRYYDKYKGVARWHASLLNTVKEQGYLEIPSGRIFNFVPKQSWRGLDWPLTTIKNYPVQGFGADLVMLARIELMRLIRESELEALLVMTVHDSLVVDTPSKNVYTIGSLINQAVESVPRLCQERWDYNFKLPLTAEIQAGPNKRDMEEIKI